MTELKKIYSTIVADPFPDTMKIILGNETLCYKKRTWKIDDETKGLRYGENPDQPAAMYQLVEGTLSLGGIKWAGPDRALVSAITEAQMLQSGKHPGKTNFTDIDNGINILSYLTAKPACVILKHNNPCGAAWKENLENAITDAFTCDSIAAFGGAVVVNRPLTISAAEFISENYFEVIAAPGFEENAVEILKRRKNLRILEMPGLSSLDQLLSSAWLDIKTLADGGLIVQKSFQNRILAPGDFIPATAKAPDGLEVTARFPDKKELEDLAFAWAVEAGVTSNSVIFAKDGITLAIGTGEQDRVGCVDITLHKAKTKYMNKLAQAQLGLTIYELKRQAAHKPELQEKLREFEETAISGKFGLQGSRMVSDGFFPFRDGVDTAIGAGVSAIAHPGGSLRDYESIIACNEAIPQVAMAFTAQRSFKH